MRISELNRLFTNTSLTPVELSEQVGSWLAKARPKATKKKLGQFFTPGLIAHYMASMTRGQRFGSKIKILDPGCGAMILTCALIEHLVDNSTTIKKIELILYENDTKLAKVIPLIVNFLTTWAAQHGVTIDTNYLQEDFILASSRHFKVPSVKGSFDIIVANPPYFKVSKSDPRLTSLGIRLSGQQNIYSLFLLVSAYLLKDFGQLIYLIPRSFTSGLYFRTFREAFLDLVNIERVHLFDSRKISFKKDEVLQETIILVASKQIQSKSSFIQISTSIGVDNLHLSKVKTHATSKIIKQYQGIRVIHLPQNSHEERAIKVFNLWKDTLPSLGLKVSTGPVVPFRSKEYLRHLNGSKTIVPLIWMHNCNKMKLNWPRQRGNKQEWIVDNMEQNSKTILSNNYVLLRRFGSKDDLYKMVATPFISKELPYTKIGLENHLNYLYGCGRELTKKEVVGLSALYNSHLFECYFRSLGGSTQISATELMVTPMPPMKSIRTIGDLVERKRAMSPASIDEIVNMVIRNT